MKRFSIDYKGEEIECAYITDAEEAKKALDVISGQPLYGLDIETTSLSPHDGKIRTIQIYDGKNTCLILDHLVPEDFLSQHTFVAHNALFESQWMLEYGIRDFDCHCSMLMYLVMLHAMTATPGEKQYWPNLANACTHVLKCRPSKEMQTSDWSAPELTDEQLEYAALDAVLPYKLFEKLAPKLQKTGLNKIYKINKEAQPALAQMMLNGIHIDKKLHQNYMKSWESEKLESEKQVQKTMKGVNLKSPKQLSDWLKANLNGEVEDWPINEKTGHLKTNADTLNMHQDVAVLQPLLKYKKYQKLLSTYGNPIEDAINPNTDRIHASFTLCQTQTGRLSCRQPNLQNQPREYGMRAVFIPEPGNVFSVADFSQIELRAAAYISRDARMIEAYEEGQDLHAITAAFIAGKKLNEVTKDERQKAKAVNFGLLFGMGAPKLRIYAQNSYGVRMSEGEANTAVVAFRELYPGYRAWQLQQANEAKIYLSAKTPSGKIRRLDSESYYSTAMNTPVQGAAAEIMLIALTKIHSGLQKLCPTASIVNVVHDEIVIEHKPEYWEIIDEILHKHMEGALLEVFPRATTKDLIEVNTGTSWQEAK